jgi:hypothetical protein
MSEFEFSSKEIYQLVNSVVLLGNTQTEILRQNTEILKELKEHVTELSHTVDLKNRDEDSNKIKLSEIAASVKGLNGASGQNKKLVQELIDRDGFWWSVTTIGTSIVLITGGRGILELIGKWVGVIK